MKIIAVIYLLVCSGLFAEPFTFDGEEYDTSLPMDFSLPIWKQGEAEPPILPNQAYRIARAAFDEQFGKKTKASVFFVVLRQVTTSAGASPATAEKKTFSCYEIIFVEQPAPAEVEKRKKAVTMPPQPQTGHIDRWSVYTANMSYYVLMDGSVITPKKKT
jgi:hypothetical protein